MHQELAESGRKALALNRWNAQSIPAMEVRKPLGAVQAERPECGQLGEGKVWVILTILRLKLQTQPKDQ